MDATPDRHAYRCLPLAIANAHGWEVAAPCAFEVRWNGGDLARDLTVNAAEEFPGFDEFARSHFANGVVTFHIGYLVRTDPGWHTIATGPFNTPEGRHRRADRRHRERLAALHVHDELADDAPGRGALRPGRDDMQRLSGEGARAREDDARRSATSPTIPSFATR